MSDYIRMVNGPLSGLRYPRPKGRPWDRFPHFVRADWTHLCGLFPFDGSFRDVIYADTGGTDGHGESLWEHVSHAELRRRFGETYSEEELSGVYRHD